MKANQNTLVESPHNTTDTTNGQATRSLSVELWRYIMWLQGSDPSLLTASETEHLVFWKAQLDI